MMKRKIINFLLGSGSLESALQTIPDLNIRDSNGETVLILWANSTNLSYRYCSQLLKYGADPNIPDKKGRTPLNILCRKSKSKQLIELFLQHGADPNILDNNGWDPLGFLSKWSMNDDYFEIIRLLVQHKANLTRHYNNRSAVHFSALGFNPKTLELLLQSGAKPDGCVLQRLLDYEVERGFNPIQVRQIAQLLLQYGADPNITEPNYLSYTSLIFDHYKNDSLITLLFNYGFRPDLSFSEKINAKKNKLDSKKRKYDEYSGVIRGVAKKNYDLVIKEVSSKANEFLFTPGSINCRITECLWHLDQYDLMKEKHPDIMKLYQITNEIEFRNRISEQSRHNV